MIVVTGAAGFIGSCLITKLNEERFYDLVIVDDFSRKDKRENWEGKHYSALVERGDFVRWLKENHKLVEFVFHLGARTDTTETDITVFNELNLNYSKQVWQICAEFALPLVYASSAATYGDGSNGYHDDHDLIANLKPLNAYGRSKQEFDLWAIESDKKPYYWAGLKFFNVYGPNEYHKGRMSSVIYHAFQQIKEFGKVILFRSHNPLYRDGDQKRDFIYVKDVVDTCFRMMIKRKHPGIYNIGNGQARSFSDLASAVFDAMDMKEAIEFIETPADIRDKYQYFTQAEISKLKNAGYTCTFSSLEDGIRDYVRNYLREKIYY